MTFGARRPVVLKFGGELLEDAVHLERITAAVRSVHGAGGSVVIVHGGGREIDAALRSAGIEKRQVDGLRITDDATLDVVVPVLAGAVNTRFVAALNTAGVPAVGLTGADAWIGLSTIAPPHRTADGRAVPLGRVGQPTVDSETRLLTVLLDGGFAPVVACVGVDRGGTLLNINADTLAAHLAARLGAGRLVVAGTTPGVLGDDGATLPVVEAADLASLVARGTATAGMIAKLRACEHAVAGGVDDVVVVDGRDGEALTAAALGHAAPSSTRVVATSGSAAL